jgi:alpha-tubulin suppressor-like RCC1 family protein
MKKRGKRGIGQQVDLEEDVIEGNELMVWGKNDYGQLGIGEEITDIEFPKVRMEVTAKPKLCLFQIKLKSVACGDEHTLLLTGKIGWLTLESGHVYGMGSNRFGQLGIGSKDYKIRSTPSLIESLCQDDIDQIICGGLFSYCISKSRRVYSWGNGEDGQLGLGVFKDFSSPQSLDLPNDEVGKLKITKIDCGPNHTVMLTDNFTVYCCGDNSFGQLGISGKCRTSSPMICGFSKDRIIDIACGTKHTLFLTGNY